MSQPIEIDRDKLERVLRALAEWLEDHREVETTRSPSVQMSAELRRDRQTTVIGKAILDLLEDMK